ncbi:MAG: hypothetical protein CML68_04210 [Rhodobacteraceae bacterium]|nr:hypothetical protein [Paracoccaceae bacterium]
MRRIFFWTHFAIGLVAALFIFVMSVTGVLLAFEKQITAGARNASITAPEGAAPLGYDQIFAAAEAQGAGPGHQLVLPSDPGAAVRLSKGRRDVTWLNPYDGSELAEPGISAVFHRIEVIHRWFALGGNRTDTGAALMAAANVVFAALLVSGVVLWWPKRWSWPQVRQRISFRKGLPTAQARNFNWHHVFSFWAFVPLIAIILSGVMISYPAISRPIYEALGSGAPQSGQGDPSAGPANGAPLPLATLATQVAADAGRWNTLTLHWPGEGAKRVQFTIDRGNGIAPATQDTLRVARDGSSVDVLPPVPTNARFFVRFLHTGEVYGVIGQAVAGLASLAAAFLVYTGVMLGIGRLRRMMRLTRRPAEG